MLLLFYQRGRFGPYFFCIHLFSCDLDQWGVLDTQNGNAVCTHQSTTNPQRCARKYFSKGHITLVLIMCNDSFNDGKNIIELWVGER